MRWFQMCSREARSHGLSELPQLPWGVEPWTSLHWTPVLPLLLPSSLCLTLALTPLSLPHPCPHPLSLCLTSALLFSLTHPCLYPALSPLSWILLFLGPRFSHSCRDLVLRGRKGDVSWVPMGGCRALALLSPLCVCGGGQHLGGLGDA